MSKLPFELLLALRYLRPKRTFVSIITLISIIGVMLGVAVLIIVISVMSGFGHDLRKAVFAFNAHLKVQTWNGMMENYAMIASTVASNRNVVGVAPSVLAQVLVKTKPVNGESQVAAPFVRGVDPETEGRVSELPRSLVAGKFDLDRNGLIVGTEFASNLNLQVGDSVEVRSPEDLRKMDESFRKLAESGGNEKVVYRPPSDFEIRGIFDAGHYELNVSTIIASLQNAQHFHGMDEEDTVHGLLVKVRDPLQAQPVARELSQMLGPDFKVTTWMEESSMMMAVVVEKNMMLYILFFIVIVAAFGITCTLITFIMMKTREIGLMKAIGATNRQVMSVFISQSLIISVLGILAGLGLGLLAVSYRNEFLTFMRKLTGFQLFPADVYGFSKLPALIVPSDVAIICGGSLLICLLAAVFPAWHASKLNPVEALRNE
jgi:lipoprotein-releasing system permease protein